MTALEGRAAVNGISCTRLGRDELRELEPNVTGLGALHLPATGIVDYSSLDVNDDGNILAAGLAADERPLVELLTWDGGLLLSCFSQPNKAGPLDVGFTRDGRAYALFRDRLLVFNVPKR